MLINGKRISWINGAKNSNHTTSWSDNQKAKGWFLTSPEGLLVRRYEFWSCDNGYDQCLEVREGSYRQILVSLLKNGDFAIEEIIEDYIEVNPNYKVWLLRKKVPGLLSGYTGHFADHSSSVRTLLRKTY
jgi:hypothetical protein